MGTLDSSYHLSFGALAAFIITHYSKVALLSGDTRRYNSQLTIQVSLMAIRCWNGKERKGEACQNLPPPYIINIS